MSAQMSLSKTQWEFLKCPADWCLFGGAAGGGKTHAISLDPLRHCQGPSANPMFRGGVFRRTFPDLTQAGGLLDHCRAMYEPLGAKYNHTAAEFRFPCGAKISLNTLQYQKDLSGFLGAQFDYLAFDECSSFTLNQIMFLWSRCRSKSGIKPVLRMTSNPDASSFLYKIIQWWLLPTGFPDPEKSGVIRHFVADGEDLAWFDVPQYSPEAGDKISTSFTFIPSKLTDNSHLMASDPAYRQRLLSLPEEERARFLDGNWNASSVTGTKWPRELFMDLYIPLEDYPVPKHREVVRMFTVDPSLGRHATRGDFSAIVALAQTSDLGYVDADLARRSPSQIVEDLFQFCNQDHHRIRSGDMIGIESVGFQSVLKTEVYIYAKNHPEYALSSFLVAGNPIIDVQDMLPKVLRIMRLSSRITNREFRYLQNPGTTLLLNQLRQFDGQSRVGVYDDGIDALEMATQLPRHLQEMYKR